MKIAVCGAGSWGVALACALIRQSEAEIALWGRDTQLVATMNATRNNPKYLQEIAIPAEVAITSSLPEALDAAGLVLLAVPSQAMRELAKTAAPLLPKATIMVSCAKGLELGSNARMTQVITEEAGPGRQVAVMSGPNIAWEVAHGLPAATVVAAADNETATRVRQLCGSGQLRIYTGTDVVGVEYGGALKNIVAIASGICDGLGFGDNAKASVMTRGIAEMARLGVRQGAGMLTFAGLAGLGDCIVTCMSKHSRNRNFGEAIGRGVPISEALTQTPMVIEGVNVSQAAVRLARDAGIEMPIATEIHAVLFEAKPIDKAIADLLSREAKEEMPV